VMRRIGRRTFNRDLTALVSSFGLACRLADANPQQPSSPRRIGVLGVSFSTESKEAQQFRQGLNNAGYTEGRDVIIEWRNANGNIDRIAGLIGDLVNSKVDVIVVETTSAALAAKRATSTLPIVMALVADPVGSGLVTNLAHPGGNVTGLSAMKTEHTAKLLQLLKETMPRLTRVAVLWNPDTPWHANVIEALRAAAPTFSIALSLMSVQMAEQLGTAFSSIGRANAQALYLLEAPIFLTHRAMLLKLLLKAHVPMIESERRFVDSGGLISFGASVGDLYLRSAWYVDKILKGAKPGDLPIEQPTKFELVVNLKTAKALGLKIPESILLRADEVIR
jgi:putative tryptophan/tyrosine transport system substrate-binding protein